MTQPIDPWLQSWPEPEPEKDQEDAYYAFVYRETHKREQPLTNGGMIAL